MSDTFLDSAWYFLRYPSTDFAAGPWDRSGTKRWLPVHQYAGGPEHVARHHLYARFVTMALHDLGLLPFAEPFPRMRLHGMVTMDGAKMTKSHGNVVNVDDLVSMHGADVTRLALLFSRPWDADGDFDDAAIVGAERFVTKVWRLVDGPDGDAPPSERAGERVGRAIESMTHNVAIAALMEWVAALRREPPSRDAKRVLVLLLAPLAPHVAEELWARLECPFSVHQQAWPYPRPA